MKIGRWEFVSYKPTYPRGFGGWCKDGPVISIAIRWCGIAFWRNSK